MQFVPAGELRLTYGQIAFALAKGNFGSHAGLVFREDGASENLRVLHFEWNDKVKISAFPGQAWRVACVLDIGETTGESMESYLRLLSKNLPKIKYGVNVDAAGGSFVDAGYVVPPGSDGLTCSTFVWAILKYQGLHPVDLSTWPAGVNVEWVREIARILYTGEVPDFQQGAKVNAQADSAKRLKPTELGVPIQEVPEDWPFTFNQASAGEPAVSVLLS